jgi:hypothetical protein
MIYSQGHPREALWAAGRQLAQRDCRIDAVVGIRIGRGQLTASRREFLLPRILACAVTGWLAWIDGGNASDNLTHIKSITLGERTIDRTHSMGWQNWTISFGRGRPFAEFSEQGMTLRGLICANSKAAPINCHVFMSMQRFESFPHFCELAPDDRHAPGSWPVRIDCPNEIKFSR